MEKKNSSEEELAVKRCDFFKLCGKAAVTARKFCTDLIPDLLQTQHILHFIMTLQAGEHAKINKKQRLSRS